MIQICACHPNSRLVIKRDIKLPSTIPPGNHIWKRFNKVFISLPSYSSAIIGLQAASVHPFPIPIKSVDIKRPVYPPEKIVKMIPKVCVKNANCIIRLGPIV